MKLRRRDILMAMEATAAAAAFPLAFGSCSSPRPKVPRRALPREAPDTWVASVCGACPGGCGIRARLVEGKLAGIAGNPLHPVSRGGLCPLGLAGAQLALHPDRVRGPLRRSGSGELRPVSWDDALSEVASRLRDLRARSLSHTVALVDGTRGLSREIAARFLTVYGSPNHLRGRPWYDDAPTEAMRLTQGATGPAAYDLENARFILAFGSGWLEGSWSPVGAARAYGTARRGRKSGRVQVVHVEPRLSVSAARADEWVPIVPGTEGTLALGLMHMILREGLEDREFLDRWGFGFDWLRAVVLRDYHPDAVSQRTGVPVATIIRVARQLASMRPSVAIGDDRSGPGVQSPDTRMAIHALNALVGAVNAPGGVLVPPPMPLDPLPDAPADEQSKRGCSFPPLGNDVAGLAGWLDGLGTYPINILFAYGADPLSLLGSGAKAAAALGRVPFVVSFSSFLDETARRADLVLPDHVWLERWQDDPSFTSRGFPVLGLQQPVIAPRHDTRHSPEVLADIARRVQAASSEAFPWRSFRDLIQSSARGIYRSGRGSLFDVPESEAWLGMMAKGGWRGSDFGTFEQFWSGLATRGGWWDPVYDFGERSRVLRAAGGKFDFSPVARAVEPRGPGQPVHLLGPAASGPPRYPLQLHLYPLLAAYGDALGPLPFVQDVLGREMEQSWTLWVELAPADARALRIRDGERVHVESAEGTVQARAKVYPGLKPGVAAMPLGPGGAPGSMLRRALAAQAGALAALDRRGPSGAGAETGIWVRVQGA